MSSTITVQYDPNLQCSAILQHNEFGKEDSFPIVIDDHVYFVYILNNTQIIATRHGSDHVIKTDLKCKNNIRYTISIQFMCGIIYHIWADQKDRVFISMYQIDDDKIKIIESVIPTDISDKYYARYFIEDYNDMVCYDPHENNLNMTRYNTANNICYNIALLKPCSSLMVEYMSKIDNTYYLCNDNTSTIIIMKGNQVSKLIRTPKCFRIHKVLGYYDNSLLIHCFQNDQSYIIAIDEQGKLWKYVKCLFDRHNCIIHQDTLYTNGYSYDLSVFRRVIDHDNHKSDLNDLLSSYSDIKNLIIRCINDMSKTDFANNFAQISESDKEIIMELMNKK
jgi:hypothetical protein